MRRRVFVVGGGWCWWWCCCCYSCCCSWWSCCWGRLAGGKLRPLVARVQHSLGLSHAPIAVAELDDAVRGLELLHVPSRLHRALLQKRDHRQQKSASAPKRLEFPPDAPTTAHDCTNHVTVHVTPNLWFHPIGKFRSVLVAKTIPPQVHSVCTCSVPPSRAETLAAFSHRSAAFASQRPGAGWLEATRTHESLPTAAPTCDVQCWPPAGSFYCGLCQALPSRELIALSGLRCRADHFQQCVRTHMCTQHASRPCTQRCHHLRRCCTCLRGVRKWWSR